jgi:hypothetical protein
MAVITVHHSYTPYIMRSSQSNIICLLLYTCLTLTGESGYCIFSGSVAHCIPAGRHHCSAVPSLAYLPALLKYHRSWTCFTRESTNNRMFDSHCWGQEPLKTDWYPKLCICRPHCWPAGKRQHGDGRRLLVAQRHIARWEAHSKARRHAESPCLRCDTHA